MGRLDGKMALVTGSSGGIGEGIAPMCAAAGASVALVARRAERLQKLADAIAEAGGVPPALPADVTSACQVERVFAPTGQQFGRLDLLVNNAGTAVRGALDALSVEDWDGCSRSTCGRRFSAPARRCAS